MPKLLTVLLMTGLVACGGSVADPTTATTLPPATTTTSSAPDTTVAAETTTTGDPWQSLPAWSAMSAPGEYRSSLQFFAPLQFTVTDEFAYIDGDCDSANALWLERSHPQAVAQILGVLAFIKWPEADFDSTVQALIGNAAAEVETEETTVGGAPGVVLEFVPGPESVPLEGRGGAPYCRLPFAETERYRFHVVTVGDEVVTIAIWTHQIRFDSIAELAERVVQTIKWRDLP